MTILFEHGADPTQLVLFQYDIEKPPHFPGYHNCISLGEYANLLGERDMFDAALLQAGWTLSQVVDLKDTEYFAGVAELFSGTISWTTEDEHCTYFSDELCQGKLVDVNMKAECLWLHMKFLVEPELSAMIEAANIAYRQKCSPGTWPTEEEVILKVNVDFQCICRGKYWLRQHRGCICDLAAYNRGRYYAPADIDLEDEDFEAIGALLSNCDEVSHPNGNIDHLKVLDHLGGLVAESGSFKHGRLYQGYWNHLAKTGHLDVEEVNC